MLKNQIKIKKAKKPKKTPDPLAANINIEIIAALDCNNCINSIKLSLAVILVTIHVYIVKGSKEIDNGSMSGTVRLLHSTHQVSL